MDAESVQYAKSRYGKAHHLVNEHRSTDEYLVSWCGNELPLENRVPHLNVDDKQCQRCVKRMRAAGQNTVTQIDSPRRQSTPKSVQRVEVKMYNVVLPDGFECYRTDSEDLANEAAARHPGSWIRESFEKVAV